MHRLVTSCAPASTLLEPNRVIRASNENGAILNLLEMAFQTQVRVALGEHLRIDRSVNRVASGAPLAQRRMFKHKRPPLRGVAFETTFVLG